VLSEKNLWSSDLLNQSWRVPCSFGTTFSPSEWRSISYGNQSGISWRGCTSFNATCHLLNWFGSASLVSLMWFLSFPAQFLYRAHGGNLEGEWVSEAILRWWRFVRLIHRILKRSISNLFCIQYLWLLGLLHPRASLTYTPCVKSYWLVSNSDPHATDLGRVESESEFVHYSSNFL